MTIESQHQRRRILQWASAALLASVTLMVYLSNLDGVFLFDDHHVVVNNDRIQQGLADVGLWKPPRGATQGSFAINFQMFGLDPRGYHWTNNLIHASSVVLLYALLLRLFHRPGVSIRSADFAAFFAALLWGVHPLCTQAVTYIVQRAESLMAMLLLAFLLILDHSSRSRHTRLWQVVAIVTFLVGVATKEVMVVALPIGLLYDRLFLSSSWRQTIRGRSVLWGTVFGLAVLATLIAVPTMLSQQSSAGFSMRDISPVGYLSTQPLVLLHYYKLMFWPDPLIFDYGWPIESRTCVVGLSSIAILALIVSALKLLPRNPLVAFFILASLTVFLPTSLVPLRDLAVEHRAYLPSAFIVAAVVYGAFQQLDRVMGDGSVRFLSIAFTAVALVYGSLTYARNSVYSSRQSVWQDVIAKTEDSGRRNVFLGRAYANLGEALADEGEWKLSIRALEKSIDLGGYPQQVHGNLARAYIELGEPKAAARHIINAMKANPSDARIRQQAGLVAAKLGQFAQAEKHFSEASRLAPKDALILFNLAKSRIALGRFDDAEKDLRKAIELRPSEAEPHRSLVSLLARQGKTQEAKKIAEELLRQNPEDPKGNLLVGSLYLVDEDLQKAMPFLERAADHSNPPKMANHTVGNLYVKLNKPNRAMKYFQRELEINPSNIDSVISLGALVSAERPRDALPYFERALEIDPANNRADFNIALIQAQFGQRDIAMQRLKKLLARSPGFAPAEGLLASLAKHTERSSGDEQTPVDSDANPSPKDSGSVEPR